jgi:nucleoside phosphorylase
MSKTLICSAWSQEIQNLKNKKIDSKYELATLGIGFLSASLALERILVENRDIEDIIFIGTAGAYSKTLEIGNIIEVKETALLNFGTVEQKAFVPEAYEEYHCFLKFDRKIKKAYCLSSLEITQDTKISKKIIDVFETRDIVENMELYGLAKVAHENSKKFSSLLGITNYTNIDAHSDWKENNESVSTKLCDILFNELSSQK